MGKEEKCYMNKYIIGNINCSEHCKTCVFSKSGYIKKEIIGYIRALIDLWQVNYITQEVFDHYFDNIVFED